MRALSRTVHALASKKVVLRLIKNFCAIKPISFKPLRPFSPPVAQDTNFYTGTGWNRTDSVATSVWVELMKTSFSGDPRLESHPKQRCNKHYSRRLQKGNFLT